MILIIAFIVVFFSIVGTSMYSSYRIEELTPKAKMISQQVSKLYQENADRRMIARMIYSDEFRVINASTYVIDTECNMITTDSQEEADGCAEFILKYAQKCIEGETVTVPRSSQGVAVGVPVYGNGSEIIGAVVLLQRSSIVDQRVNSIAKTFGIIMIAALLLALIPSMLIVRSVTKPIKSVSETALRMASGDLSARAEVKGSFESQHLAESFNVLAGALQSNIDYLIIERNRLNAVLNGIAEGIIAVDKNGNVTHFNECSVQLLGGTNGDEPERLENYPLFGNIIEKVLSEDRMISQDVSLRDHILCVTATPIHEDSDELYGAVALIRDVTESERLEQTRRDYVANVSHELRTPLASIRSLADALSDGLVQDEADKKRYYGYIQRESIRLSTLIDDLLELSRLQSGGVAFTKLKVELYEILYDVADRMNETASQRGKGVRLLVPEDEYYAFTNSDRVEQVLVALTDNAVKHSTDEAFVDIELGISDDGKKYLFSVSNRAEVDPADLEHIFERFYKADHAHSNEGTGLGLAIVSEVLNLLDEKISVQYSSGIIRFTFTVQRDETDLDHPLLANRITVDSLSGESI